MLKLIFYRNMTSSAGLRKYRMKGGGDEKSAIIIAVFEKICRPRNSFLILYEKIPDDTDPNMTVKTNLTFTHSHQTQRTGNVSTRKRQKARKISNMDLYHPWDIKGSSRIH